jgi:capsular polysaccharide biosynthesis protein
LDLIEAFTAQLGRGLTGLGERLYFTREKAGRRQVANEAALWAKLDELGFAKIALEDLSWAEQIAACRRARVVVSPHGAGLANLAFCAPGTRVVELVNREYFNPGYWRLAALQGLDYRVVMPDGESSLGEDRSANRNDIIADLGRVSAALR